MSNLTADTIELREAFMGTIVSHVPELLKKNGWSPMVLVRKGMSVDTAYRLAEGDVNFSIRILKLLCEAFEVGDVSEVITFVKSDEAKTS